MEMTTENPQPNKPQESPGDNSPEKYRLVLMAGGMVLGVMVAYLFGLFSRGSVKTLDLVFWAVGGALIGFFASVHDPRKKT
jgi:hypothetical protein